MNNYASLVLSLGVLLAALSGCTGSGDAAVGPGQTVVSTSTTSEPSRPLTPREIYDLVSPSIAFVETETSTGSAVLFDNGWLVSNAHVVWPEETVRVVFADGEDHDAVPVIRINDYLDLALLGPVDTDHAGVPLSDASVETADHVFLIGYPAESEEFPTPTITSGLVSRLRTWEAAGIDFIQSDTAIAGGQSGGALVSADGAVVGISGLSFSDANFALSIPIDTVAAAAAELSEGASPDAFATAPIGRPTSTEATIQLRHGWDEETLVFEGSDEPIEVVVSGGSEPFLTVIDGSGEVLYPGDEEVTPVIGPNNSYTFTFDTFGFGPVYAYVTDVAADRRLTVTANQPFTHLTDRDDARRVRPGDTIKASFGAPADYDWYTVELEAGQTIIVTADSLGDVELLIDLPDEIRASLAEDFDSGGGVFATNPEIEFSAEETGPYVIVAYEAFGEAPTGYVLDIQ